MDDQSVALSLFFPPSFHFRTAFTNHNLNHHHNHNHFTITRTRTGFRTYKRGNTTQYRTTEEEVILTRLLEKAIRRSEAVDREALCVVAGEKVRRLACSVFTSCSAVSSQADTHVIIDHPVPSFTLTNSSSL